MKVRSHKLKDHDFGDAWKQQTEDRWNYADFLKDENWRKDWISFDGVVAHTANDLIYCGITSFDADIFRAWNRSTQTWQECGFGTVADPYDAKFHRSMELTQDGRYLYCATALLHDIDRYFEAPGGGIFRHDTQTGATEKLGIPLPHNYIQSIVLDEARGVLYAMHFTPERLSVFDLSTRAARDLGPIGSGLAMAQGENLVLDDEGNCWCGWCVTRAWQGAPGADAFRLCKYSPGQNKIIFYDHGLPRADGEYGFAKVEGLFNLGTGCLYASGDNGSLYRIETKNGEVKYLGTPISDRRSRLTSLALHPDGFAYGITGRDGACRLLRFDPRNDSYEIGEKIIDENGVAMWQCHDIDVTADGVLFAGENDHPRRSSYLWEINL
jgi:hypothetical protein